MLSIFDWHNLWLINISAQNQFGTLWKQSLLHQEGTKEMLSTCKIWKQMFILNFRMNSLPLFDTCVTFCKEITFAHVWEYGNLIVNNEIFNKMTGRPITMRFWLRDDIDGKIKRFLSSPDPNLGNLVLFSDVKIQDLKVTWGLKGRYINNLKNS